MPTKSRHRIVGGVIAMLVLGAVTDQASSGAVSSLVLGSAGDLIGEVVQLVSPASKYTPTGTSSIGRRQELVDAGLDPSGAIEGGGATSSHGLTELTETGLINTESIASEKVVSETQGGLSAVPSQPVGVPAAAIPRRGRVGDADRGTRSPSGLSTVGTGPDSSGATSEESSGASSPTDLGETATTLAVNPLVAALLSDIGRAGSPGGGAASSENALAMDILLGRPADGTLDRNGLGIPGTAIDIAPSPIRPEEFLGGARLVDLYGPDLVPGGPDLTSRQKSSDGAADPSTQLGSAVPGAPAGGLDLERRDLAPFGPGFGWPPAFAPDVPSTDLSRARLIGDPSALAIDPVPVPEPGTLVLFGLGLAGLASRLRRRVR